MKYIIDKIIVYEKYDDFVLIYELYIKKGIHYVILELY